MELDSRIAEWRAFLGGRREIDAADVQELEGHLRDQVDTLRSAGLDDDEAFLVAVKRLGSIDSLTREFSLEHSERLWKQLIAAPGDAEPRRGDFGVMLIWAFAAAIVVQLPRLLWVDAADVFSFYVRNTGLLVLPMVIGYFAWKRQILIRRLVPVAAIYVLGAVVANAYPYVQFGQTETLSAIHLSILLWLMMGVVYVGGQWQKGRMDFIRFTGESFIYYVLIALGGAVLIALASEVFRAIGISADTALFSWVAPSGAAGALVVAAWLVEAKQSVIENMAPVLTKVFTPLFAALFIASIVAMLWTGHGIDQNRDVLILFDVLLVVVLGLVLYAISARDPLAEPTAPDVFQLVLVASALVIDMLALVAILSRITDMGFTANRTAGLGLNLVLLVNLTWSAWLSFRFLRGRRPFADLERWQTAYVPVYAAWAALVVVVFPIVFGFV
jgi:hypothetical protein